MGHLLKQLMRFVKALVAVLRYGYPARRLKIIGVTGTDGKTTTVNLIFHILKKAGKKVSMISTVDAVILNKHIETGLHTTTPDAWLMQSLLVRMVKKGSEFVVIEATSHGLHQHRLLGINFLSAVLTNITHEHQDYHKSYDNYLRAKAKLFRSAKIAILNRKDSSFKRIRKLLRKSTIVRQYPAKNLDKAVKAAIEKRFPESYNQLNAEAAYWAVSGLGIKKEIITQAILGFPGICGRMEEIKNKKGFRVIVDFAHTPNALEKVLKTLKSQIRKRGKLIAVFGCAGERDTAKRPMMAKISARLADISVFTAEDPRYEEVEKIIDQMVCGVRKEANKYYRIPDRKKAIEFAIKNLARKDDIVVICGKGHEKSMAYGDKEIPWSDSEAAQAALRF